MTRPDKLPDTNLGMGGWIDDSLKKLGKEDWLNSESVVELYHQRGRDELVFRSLKDFGSEKLPFKKNIRPMAYGIHRLTVQTNT